MNYLEYGTMSCSTTYDGDMFYVNNLIMNNTSSAVASVFLNESYTKAKIAKNLMTVNFMTAYHNYGYCTLQLFYQIPVKSSSLILYVGLINFLTNIIIAINFNYQKRNKITMGKIK
ncbi:MAG: hypothetical protein FWH37_06260 [Candidatus Bathyarchaeota archaeon]|nr:hypothetical protein [Candidatus Termiticorpusculum sp.]